MVASALGRTDRVALDCETTGLDPREGRVRLLSLAVPGAVHVIDCFRLDPRPLLPQLARKLLVGHNLAFDLSFLRVQFGFEPGACADTMLLAKLLSAGLPEAKQPGFHTLAAVAQRVLGEALRKDQQKSDWSGTLTREQLNYAARDATVLLPLLDRLEAETQQAGLRRVAEIEHRALPAIVWLRCAGVSFDAEAWEKLASEAERDRDRLRADLDRLAPPPPGLALGLGWNWDSPTQAKRALELALGEALLGTDDETLAGLDHPLAEVLRRYRAVAKRASTYGSSWPVSLRDGRLFPDWQQLGAATGRMACREPNLQNLPGDSRYRACVRAPDGRVLVKADYSQIELRLAAKIAGDRRMLEAFQAGADLHAFTAQALLGRDPDDSAEWKRARQLAKAVNFGFLYGMGAEAFRSFARANYGLTLYLPDAKRYRERFFRAYPGLAQWHRQQPDGPIETRTLAGRRRLQVEQLTEKLNSPVQGSGADGLKTALALLWERRAECPGAVPVIACHDELVVECDAEQAEAAAAWLRQAMVDAMAPLLDPVPVEVEAVVVRDWGGGR